MSKLMLVIVNESTRGTGNEGDMCRQIKEYFSLDGILLAVHDPLAPQFTTWSADGKYGEYFQVLPGVAVMAPEKTKRAK